MRFVVSLLVNVAQFALMFWILSLCIRWAVRARAGGDDDEMLDVESPEEWAEFARELQADYQLPVQIATPSSVAFPASGTVEFTVPARLASAGVPQYFDSVLRAVGPDVREFRLCRGRSSVIGEVGQHAQRLGMEVYWTAGRSFEHSGYVVTKS